MMYNIIHAHIYSVFIKFHLFALGFASMITLASLVFLFYLLLFRLKYFIAHSIFNSKKDNKYTVYAAVCVCKSTLAYGQRKK